MAEKRKLAFYIRLSDADEEVKEGTKDESNSITGQRKLLYAYIKKKMCIRDRYNIPPEIAGLVTLTKDSLTVQ